MRKILTTFSLLALASVGEAAMINPGFETGDKTGWSGDGEVVTIHSGDYGTTYNPMAGNYFLRIGGGARDAWQTATQNFNLSVGQTISGWAALDWRDWPDFFDSAQVRILDENGTEVAVPYLKTGANGEDYADYPWTSWSYTATVAGVYTIEFGILDFGDGHDRSYGLFDIQSVPEPGTLGLLALGLIGMGLVRRKVV